MFEVYCDAMHIPTFIIRILIMIVAWKDIHRSYTLHTYTHRTEIDTISPHRLRVSPCSTLLPSSQHLFRLSPHTPRPSAQVQTVESVQ